MAWNSWDPFRELEAIRHEVDRVFNESTWEHRAFPFSRFSFLPGRAARAYPLMNTSEDENNLYIEAMTPGIDPKAIKISVVRNQLTIEGEKLTGDGKVKPEAYHRCERAAGRFVRQIALPWDVEQEKVVAEYRNGVLLVTLPKAEASKPRQIAVKAA